MPRITFITPGGERQEIVAESGLSVMEIARMHDLGLEGACEGSIACATCHVIVDGAYAERLEERFSRRLPGDDGEVGGPVALGGVGVRRLRV